MNNKKIWLSIIMAMLTINVVNIDPLIKLVGLIVLSAFYYFVLDKTKITKRGFIISLILAFCYTMLNIVGKYLCSNATLDKMHMLSMFVSEIIIFTFVVIFLLNNRNINTSIKTDKIDKLIYHKHFKLHLIIFLFICHLPAFIASFPGVFAYDAPGQFTRIMNGVFENWQPLLSSLVLYSVITTGKFLFSSWEGGLAFFIILQMFLCFYVISYLCDYLKRRKVDSGFILITILFFALLPINHLFTINAGKDTIFTFMFLFLIVVISELIDDPKKFFQNPKKIIQIILITLVVLFYRNNGIYVWIVTSLIFLLVLKKYRIKWSIVMLCTIVPYLLITHPLYDYLGVRNENTREMMSVPAQSILRTYLNKDDMDKKYKKQIKYFFDTDNKKILSKSYHPYNGDGAKIQLNDKKLLKHKKEFVELFLNLSIRYPKEFIKAWLYNTIGYWYPDAPDFTREYPFIEYRNSVYEVKMMPKRYNFIPVLSNYYKNLGQSVECIDYLGLLSFFGSMGLIFWVYLFLIGYILYRKKYKILLTLLPLGLLWCTNLLGPVGIFRYCYPLFVSLPLFIGILLFKKKQQ